MKNTLIRIAICDDTRSDQHDLKLKISQYCEAYSIPYEIIVVSTPQELMEVITNIDLLFLDIILNNQSGIDIAKYINKLNLNITIIFCTNYIEYSPEAFEVNAFRYLLKPVDSNRLHTYLDDFFSYHANLTIELKDIKIGDIVVNIVDIIYIEMNGRVAIVYLENGSIIHTYKRMKDFEAKLKVHNFELCIKGVLINLRKISTLDKDHLILNNKTKHNISRSYRKKITSKYHKMISRMY